MASLEEQIAQGLLDSQRSGELRSARNWGRALDLDDDYARTPLELRLAFKVLKNAGHVPAEVLVMQEIAALRSHIARSPDAPATQAARRRLSDLQQHLALRLEKLRLSGSL